jgi:hypothetical protein
LEGFDAASGKVVIEGHLTTAERAGRNKKGRTKGRQGDGLRQGEHEAKETRRRYVTLRFRWSEQSKRSKTSAKIRFRAQRPSYRYTGNVELPHRGLVFYKPTKYPSALVIGGICYSDPPMLIAVTPRQFPLKDDNALRLVNAFMRYRERLLGRGVRCQVQRGRVQLFAGRRWRIPVIACQ